MSYNFDEYIDRTGTNSAKWDHYSEQYPGLDAQGCIPMWVADTDFRAPQAVIDALVAKAEYGIFGYSRAKTKAFDDAVINWIEKRHGWRLEPEWIVPTGGVVPAITCAIQALTKEGEGIVIQPPVYYPFKDTIINNNRQVIENPLRLNEEEGQYEIDFVDLERKLKDPQVKMFILCNPHNPVGRVWEEKDLRKIGGFCLKYNVLIFADEIHGDLILPGYKHIPMGLLDEEIRDITITSYSPSKTFNLAGLQASAMVIPNKTLRQEYQKRLRINRMTELNYFATTALEVAYTHGEEYLEGFLEYISGNIAYAMDFVEKNLPGVRIIKPQGTYLVWFDFRGTGLPR